MSKPRGAREYAIILDDLFESLEEGDFFHPDAHHDAQHDKAGRHPVQQAQKCPPGELRSKVTGRCVSIRGGFNRR